MHFPGKLQVHGYLPCPAGQPSPPVYLGLVPGLRLSPAAAGHVVILSLDLGHNRVHVELPTVVHLDHHRGVRDL